MRQKTPSAGHAFLQAGLAAILAVTLAASASAPAAKAQLLPPIVFDPSRNAALVDQLARMVDQLRELQLRTSQLDRDLLRLGGWVGVPSQELTLTPSLQMDGLSYRTAGIAGAAEAVLPGYRAWADYVAELEKGFDEVLLTYRSVLEAMHAHDATITDYTRLDDLRAAAQGTQGNLQALQNGNEIRTYVAAQVQSLRQMIAMLANIEAVAMAQQANDRARRAAVSLKTSRDVLGCLHSGSDCR